MITFKLSTDNKIDVDSTLIGTSGDKKYYAYSPKNAAIVKLKCISSNDFKTTEYSNGTTAYKAAKTDTNYSTWCFTNHNESCFTNTTISGDKYKVIIDWSTYLAKLKTALSKLTISNIKVTGNWTGKKLYKNTQ